MAGTLPTAWGLVTAGLEGWQRVRHWQHWHGAIGADTGIGIADLAGVGVGTGIGMTTVFSFILLLHCRRDMV